MRPWRTWLACLGVLGALWIVAGCGSGDIPDPGSDSQAAAPPESVAPPQPVAPAPAPAQQADAQAKAQEAPAEEKEATAQADAPAPAPTEQPAERPAAGAGGNAPAGDRSSATAEMLALAQKEQPAPQAGGGEGAAGGNAPPGGGPQAAAGPQGAGGPQPGMAMGMGMAGQMQQQQQQQQMQRQMQNQMQASMQRNMQGQMQGQMRPGGGPPGAGPGGPDQPADFRTPEGAVKAFLDALKAHDLNRLTEATALRAGQENETKKRNQEMFKRIFDGTLSDSELNDLATFLEGYQVSQIIPQRSTNRAHIVLSKRDTKNKNSRNMTTVVMYARLEKKGWGVVDISLPAEIKSPTFAPRGSTRSRK